MREIKPMWRKIESFSFRSLSRIAWMGIYIAAIFVCNAPQRSSAQDSTTQRSLRQLEQLLERGSAKEIQDQIQLIIGSSGYIEQLADVLYRLAENETDAAALIKNYITIIDKWPKTARAQQSVLAVVPLIIMSGGELGQREEDIIWRRENDLLAPAPDAANLGENPEELRADVFIQLLHLAHYRNDAARITILLALTPPRASIYQDQIDLAAAFAKARIGDKANSRTALLNWLGKYSKSNYRPLAVVALYQASDQSQISEALSMFRPYQDTLESLWLQNNLGVGAQQ